MLEILHLLRKKGKRAHLFWLLCLLLLPLNKGMAKDITFISWGSVFSIEQEITLDYRYPEGFLSEAVSVAPDGKSFVVLDWEKKQVVKFDEKGQLSKILAKNGGNPDQVSFPLCVKIDKKGNIFIGDNKNRRVSVFSSEGKFLTSFIISPDHWQPLDIEIDVEGSLYLIGRKAYPLPEEWHHLTLKTEIEEKDSFNLKLEESVNDSILIMTSARAEWVNRYNSEGKYMGSFAHPPSVVSELNLWKGVTANAAMDEEDFLYLLFSTEHRIYQFSKEGKEVAVFGENPDWFVSPRKLPSPSYGSDEEDSKFWKSWTQSIKILYLGKERLLTVIRTNGLVKETDKDFLLSIYSKKGKLVLSGIETDYFPFGVDSTGHTYFFHTSNHKLNIVKTKLKDEILR